jgi:hypothetical protein
VSEQPERELERATPERVVSVSEDVLTREQVAQWLGVTKRTIADEHHASPPIPYVRHFRKPYYFRSDIIGWLREIQQLTDPVAVDVRRARGQLAGGKH